MAVLPGADHRVAAVIFFLLGLVVSIFGLLFLIEGVLLWLRQAPITEYIRNYDNHYSFTLAVVGAILLVGIGMAITHFLLDRPVP